jgi:hypothetical protein
MLHISAARPAPVCLIISGAIHGTDPLMARMLSSIDAVNIPANCLEHPKSASFAIPLLLTKTLAPCDDNDDNDGDGVSSAGIKLNIDIMSKISNNKNLYIPMNNSLFVQISHSADYMESKPSIYIYSIQCNSI